MGKRRVSEKKEGRPEGVGTNRNLPTLSMEDIVIRRDEAGEVVPIKATCIALGAVIELRPLPYGSILKWGDQLAEPIMKWPDDMKVEVLRRITVPDLTGITTEWMKENLDLLTIDELTAIVAAYSGPLRAVTQREASKGAGDLTQDPTIALLMRGREKSAKTS